MAANFELRNKPLPLYAGGPDTRCAVCKFEYPYPWYLVFNNAHSELEYSVVQQGFVGEGNVHLCSTHALEIQALLNENFPEAVEAAAAAAVEAAHPELAKLKAAVLKAEAARAKAERRAVAAEKFLHAMQDVISGMQDDSK